MDDHEMNILSIAHSSPLSIRRRSPTPSSGNFIYATALAFLAQGQGRVQGQGLGRRSPGAKRPLPTGQTHRHALRTRHAPPPPLP
ncbi:hypothetical protein VDGL01_00605 [Verticillium dahliae]